MNLEQYTLERLRSIVNLKGWDYGVLWRLGDDKRFLELVDCCCGGSQSQNYGEVEGLIFPGSCRDVMIQHPKTTSCELLVQLPSSMPLDSGMYAQILMSNQARWLNFCRNSGYSDESVDTIGTKFLVPITIGLLELFIARQIPEDQEIIDCITSECSILLEQHTMALQSNIDSTFSVNASSNEFRSLSHSFLPLEDQNDPKGHDNLMSNPFQISQPIFQNNSNLPHDINVERVQIDSPINYFRSLDHTLDDMSEAAKASNEVGYFKFSAENEDLVVKEEMRMMKNGGGRGSESASDCSEDEDHRDGKCGSRRSRGSDKEPQSKNLHAERNRRKKLNDRLYALRALVPNITKLDRASILGDAIKFVKELQTQVEDLKHELEGNYSDNGDHDQGTQNNRKHARSDVVKYQNGNENGNRLGLISEAYEQKSSYDSDNYDKLRQMEPQVEVAQLEGNEFFVKIFCEHKSGGFLRLMEALNSMGLEVTSVNVTSFLSLVSNVLKVERKDSDIVEADHVRNSLLEITRNLSGGWPQY